jgi:hypothetical protein
MPRPLYLRERDPVPIAEEAGCAPGPVWTGEEKLTPPPRFDPRTVQPGYASIKSDKNIAHILEGDDVRTYVDW